jgi:4-amino-4-deoxy-L-arabinose transferase-like glycosyltransferase
LAIASFFRLWQLDKIPPGLYPDVAINGNDALDSLKTGNFKVFYPENNGREGLMMWLIALSFSVFGVSIWSIKIVAAIIGILTVLGLYLFTKELFNNSILQHYNNPTIIAFLASFFLAISFWHTNFSRIGFRAILVPFILVFSFYFLFKGFRTKKIRDSIFSGIIFGLGFYTYISFRMAVILLAVTLIFWWLVYKKQNLQKTFLSFVICYLLFVILIALPIGVYFLQHPQDFIGRAVLISIFAAENPIKEFGKSLILHLGMFNFYGDPNWRHNFSGKPELFWPTGILFLIGFIFSIKEIIKNKDLSLVIEPPKEARGEKKTKFSLTISHLSLVIWFFVMLLPGILTYEGIPHSLRVIGVIPVVYIFVALGSLKVYQFFERNTKRKKLLIFACLLFLIAISFSEFDKYFVRWGKNSEVENAFSSDYVKMGNYLNSLPPETQKYVIVNRPGVPVSWPNGIPMPAQTIMFIENTKYGSPQSNYLLPKDLDKIKIEKDTIILPMKYEKDLFEDLQKRFPEGEIKKINEIWFYHVQ